MRADRPGPGRRGLTIRGMMVAVVFVALVLWMIAILRWAALAVMVVLAPATAVGVVVVVLKRRATEQDSLLWVLSVVAARRLPLAPGLAAFSGQWGKGYQRRLRTLVDLLSIGQPLAEALDRVPGLLRPGVLMMIRAGDDLGLLVESVREAALHRRERGPGFSAVLGRVAYLLGVLFVVQAITGFMLYFITPKIEAIFVDFGVDMPPASKAVIASGHLLASSWVPLAIVGAILACLLLAVDALVGRSGGGSLVYDRLTRGRQMPEVLRTLAVAVEGGRPVGLALDALARRHPSAWFRSRLAASSARVEAGEGWARSLRRVGLLRPSEAALLASAERVGNLPWALRELALAGDRRFGFRLQAITQVLFPLAILAVGAVVFVLALAYFGPLIKLLEALSG